VLKSLEGVSRTSWLLATAVQPLAFVTETEVLTLGFASQHDVAKFKGTTPGSGPSDHLRTAIEQQLGVRVKYLPAPMPAGGAPRQPATPSSARPADDAPASEPASASPTRTKTRDSGAPVTEWAVAPIPASADAAPVPVAASSATSTVAAPAAEAPAAHVAAAQATGGSAPRGGGDSVVRDEPPHPVDDEPPYFDDEPPYDPSYEPAPAATAAPTRAHSGVPAPSSPARETAASRPRPTASASAAPVITERTPSGGVQRYGEAVIRQVLGATFVREEPYEPPTRFS